MIETVEHVTHLCKTVTQVTHLPVTGILQDVQLNIEQFLELEPVLRQLQLLGVLGEVYYAQGIVERHETMLAHDVCRQRLLHLTVKKLEQVLHQLCHRIGVEPATLHLLGGVVVRLQSHTAQLQCGGVIHIGMRNVYPAIEHGRLAEHHVLRM